MTPPHTSPPPSPRLSQRKLNQKEKDKDKDAEDIEDVDIDKPEPSNDGPIEPTSKRGDMWTASEDEAVMQGVQQHGFEWQMISGTLSGRSINAVRNRYLRLAPFDSFFA